MIINEAIKQALSSLIEAKGNKAQAALHLHCNQSQLQKWMTGDTGWITDAVWERILPFLRPYLPSDLVTKQISLPNPAPNPVMGIPMTERQPAPPIAGQAPPIAQAAIRDSVRKDYLHTEEPIGELEAAILEKVRELSTMDKAKLLTALDSGKCPHCPDPPPAFPTRPSAPASISNRVAAEGSIGFSSPRRTDAPHSPSGVKKPGG